jgi:hypothetical protein
MVTILDTGVHDFFCLRANPIVGGDWNCPPDICFGSARAIGAHRPAGISERTIQRSLDKLERLGWIKRWVPKGRHGNYPILIARFAVADLSGRQYLMDAQGTRDWNNPKLEPIAKAEGRLRAATGDDSGGGNGDGDGGGCQPSVGDVSGMAERPSGADSSPYPELQGSTAGDGTPACHPKSRNPSTSTEHTTLQKKAPLPLFKPAKEYAEKSWGRRFRARPTWYKKDFVQLAALLRKHGELTLEEIRARWDRYLDDSDSFIAKMGHSLAFFCSRFDAHIDRAAIDLSEAVPYED